MATRTTSQQNRARAQAENASRRRRKRRHNRTLHHVLLAIILTGVFIPLCGTVFFKIQAVEVVGADKYVPDEIVAASGVVVGENLFRIHKSEIEKKLLAAFPYIYEVEIRRKLPPKVEIAVTQAQPIGAILQGDEVAFISDEGKVLERGELLIPQDILVVRGIDVGAAAPGEILGDYTPVKLEVGEELSQEEQGREDQKKQLANETKEKLGMLQYLLAAMEQSSFERLTNVDLTDRLNMQIKYENRIVMNMGSEADLADKLKLCKNIIDEQIEKDAQGTMTPDLSRRRVYFRRTSLNQPKQDEVVFNEGAAKEKNSSAGAEE